MAAATRAAKFFLRPDGCGVLGWVVRPHRDMAKAEPREQGAHAPLCEVHAVSGFNHLRQIGPAPADDTMLGQVGTGADEARDLGLLLGRQARRRSRGLAVRQPGQAMIVVAMHPIAQGLTIHATDLRRLGARTALEHKGERKHAPGRVRILCPRRCLPQTGRIELCPGECNRQSCPLRIGIGTSESQPH